MTAVYIVLLLIVLLLALGWIPLGADAAYHGGLQVRVRVGFLRFTVYPAPEKGKKKTKAAKPKTAAGEKKRALRFPNRRQIAYTLEVLLPALRKALERLGRWIQIPVLRLRVVFAGEDPADVAVLYGKAQAAAAAALPLLERCVRIGETDVRLTADYTAEETAASGELRVRIRLGALLVLGVSALGSVVSWLRGYRALEKQETDGAKKRPAQAASAA